MKEQVILPYFLSNNEAKFDILILGLKACVKGGIEKLMAKGYASLIVKQVLGIWACKNDQLKTKVKRVHNLLSQFKEVQLYSKEVESRSQCTSTMSCGRKNGSKNHDSCCHFKVSKVQRYEITRTHN